MVSSEEVRRTRGCRGPQLFSTAAAAQGTLAPLYTRVLQLPAEAVPGTLVNTSFLLAKIPSEQWNSSRR